MYTDYMFSHQLRGGFNDGFTERDRKVVGDIPVPFGTTDMASYLSSLGEADALAVFFAFPTETRFKQRRFEHG